MIGINRKDIQAILKCIFRKLADTKNKKWCQNGVKSRKSDDYKEEKVLQTP